MDAAGQINAAIVHAPLRRKHSAAGLQPIPATVLAAVHRAGLGPPTDEIRPTAAAFVRARRPVTQGRPATA